MRRASPQLIPRSIVDPRSEGWQPECVSTILHPEDTEEEAVHAEQDSAPQEDGNLLSSGIRDSRYLEGEGDRSERENTIYASSVQLPL